MRAFVVALLLSALATSLVCDDDKLWIKVTKKSKAYANEESFIIFDGATEVAKRDSYTAQKEEVDEYCITPNTNNQFSLSLRDKYGDSWSAGSWIMITGVYDNIFFKNMMVGGSKDDYSLSLYYPIMKNQEWKMTTSATGDWTTYGFADADWTSVTLGSETPSTVTGTQYFRKQFTGVTGMAAYEARFNYQYGIVAYVNGAEVFRDNMPTGTVTSATLASGGYTSVNYHGFIRPGSEVASAQSILAVELHFQDAEAHSVDFNAFVALLTPTSPATTCFIVSEDYTYTSTTFDPYDAFDFNAESGASTSFSSPVDVNIAFSGLVPFVNGLRFWPHTKPAEAPKSFTLSGSNGSGQSAQVMSITGLTFTSKVNRYAYGYFNGGLFKNYVLHVTETSASKLSLYELQPLVCSLTPPSEIEYRATSYSFIVNIQEANIAPIISDFTGCTVSPALPAGMTLSASTCIITGVPTVTVPATTYTISSVMNQVTYTGTISIEVSSCNNILVDLRRVYAAQSNTEYFNIKNSAEETLYVIEAASTQIDNTITHDYLCLTPGMYTAYLQSSKTLWNAMSYLYIDAHFDDVVENVLRARYDTRFGLASFEFSLLYPVPAASQWKYKMGEVPANWQTGDVSAWSEAAKGSFPDSSNAIQLYRKSFTVATLENYAGIVLSLRYKFGCIVYLNGHEAFRNGVVGELSTSSTPENIYSEVMYRTISLPLKVPGQGSQSAVSYVQQGANTIAIAMVSTSSVKTSFFDCMVRFMAHGEESRVMESYTVTSDNIADRAANIFDDCNNYAIEARECGSNYVAIQFANDRREWINSVVVQLQAWQEEQYPRDFVFQARNNNDEAWTTLRTATSMTWSQSGQAKRIWMLNSNAYNQYRFANISTTASDCYWKLGRLAIFSTSTNVEILALRYVNEGETLSVYKDIEMAEAYPQTEGYISFSVQPALPAGLTLDPNSGMISGTATAFTALTTYTITGTNLRGETSTALLPLIVSICTGDRSLITLVARTDEWGTQGAAFKLFEGKEETEEPYREQSGFPVANGLNYVDWCLPHNLYLFQMEDTFMAGWEVPAGWYLSVDVGAMKLEVHQMGFDPSTVTTLFSSYLPFQVEYSDWAFSKTAVAADWASVSFDASAWTTGKAAEIGTNEAVTTYIRKEFTIPNLEDYSVMNMRVKYTGGVVAYFNGHKVARFNLAEDFDASTESIEAKAQPVFSVFHVILNTVQAATDKNVIAFEVHRPKDTSSSEPVVFDATGVFGVNECSVVLDSYAFITEGCADYFDLATTSYGSLPNTVGTSMEWTVENLEGSRFNRYAWEIASSNANGWGFSLYARFTGEAEYTAALELSGQTAEERTHKTWDVPVGIAAFREFKYTIDSASSAEIVFSSNYFMYCRSSGAVCPGIDEYPPVNEDQISPAKCAEGFRGYSYRECAGGVLGDVKTDKCEYKLPANLAYDATEYEFVMNTEVSTSQPTYDNIVMGFEMSSATPLPEGLTLNEETGVISGKPVAASDGQYVVYAKNPMGSALVELTIKVRKAYCYAEGQFPVTEPGNVAVYECSTGGSYIGTRRRECVMGSKDGEWKEPTGTCVSILLIVVVIVVVIIVIVVIVLIAVKASKTKKASKAVKGGKAKAMKKATHV